MTRVSDDDGPMAMVRELIERAAAAGEGLSIALLAERSGWAEITVGHAVALLKRAGALEVVKLPHGQRGWRVTRTGAVVPLPRGGRKSIKERRAAASEQRLCLRCRELFASAWIGNRLCQGCAGVADHGISI